MSRVDVFAAALDALDAGRGVAFAVVTGASGSTPRHLGARMAVADDGAQWGTIGGGKIEQVVVAAAKDVAAGAAPMLVKQHLIRDLAMCCGGAMEVAITPAKPSRDVVAILAASKRPHTLETPLDGGTLLVRDTRDDDPRPHEPRVIDGKLVERVGLTERVVMFGHGHVARMLGPLLDDLGFAIAVCDDGETGAIDEAPPWADKVVESFDAAEVEHRLGGFSANDYVLIITRDHAIDQKLLETLIRNTHVGYLGMIGSRGKVGRFLKRLEAKQIITGADDPHWKRLRAPIGLDIGAETPEEIAVAIAAELVARRRRGVAAASDWRPVRAARSGDDDA